MFEMISVIVDSSLGYPAATGGFSPYVRFPEYRFAGLSPARNDVYECVRRLFSQAGLDAAHYGAPDWNPLGAYIRPGQSVFVLCNFVYHRRGRETEPEFHAKCTHAAVLRPVLDYALAATGERGKVRYGNAPLQSCEWHRVIADTGALAVKDFYAAAGVANIAEEDLRGQVVRRDALGRTSLDRCATGESAVTVQLDRSGSWLDKGALDGSPRYRVADYGSRRTEGAHARCRHRYEISRAVLNSDVLISVPKLKTHEKVGVTCGLKGLVGAVTGKDCLAHHRQGGPADGGDEYPRSRAWRMALSRLHDQANNLGTATLGGNLRIADYNIRRLLNVSGFVQAGAWYGNDTAWRMVLDLYRIVTFARADGTIADSPQRRHLMIVDGIVAGEGNGPLAPSPRRAGCLLLSDDLPAGDAAAACLMGFDPARIALIREALQASGSPGGAPRNGRIVLNGASAAFSNLAALQGLPFKPPHGWAGHIERVTRS